MPAREGPRVLGQTLGTEQLSSARKSLAGGCVTAVGARDGRHDMCMCLCMCLCTVMSSSMPGSCDAALFGCKLGPNLSFEPQKIRISPLFKRFFCQPAQSRAA